LLETAVVKSDRRLVLKEKNEIEVALVYYRVMYDPSQFLPNEEASWRLRLEIETSKAIKCPSIGYQLSGVKKFQQVVKDRKVLEKLLPTVSPAMIDSLSSTFAGLWSLDSDEVVKEALENSINYVMKPQREGGGHNYYGQEIVDVLGPISNSPSRKAFILMQKINSLEIDNILIGRDIDPVEGHVDSVTCELGIFGSILATDKNNVLFNNEDGHVLRCKKIGVNEGGISAGFGAIDSPFLY